MVKCFLKSEFPNNSHKLFKYRVEKIKVNKSFRIKDALVMFLICNIFILNSLFAAPTGNCNSTHTINPLVKETITQYWKDSIWNNTQCITNTYNSKKLLVENDIKTWSDGKWCITHKQFYKYDKCDKKIESTSYIKHAYKDSFWVTGRSLFTYNKKGYLISYDVTDTYKEIYTRDDKGQLLETECMLLNSGIWLKNTKKLNSYNAAGFKTKTEILGWSPNYEKWCKQEETTYTLNESDHTYEETRSFCNCQTDQCSPNEKIVSHFDDNSDTLKIDDFSVQNDIVLNRTTVFNYDSSKKQVERIFYVTTNGTDSLVPQEKVLKTLNENGYIEKEIVFIFKDGVWNRYYTKNYTYIK